MAPPGRLLPPSFHFFRRLSPSPLLFSPTGPKLIHHRRQWTQGCVLHPHPVFLFICCSTTPLMPKLLLSLPPNFQPPKLHDPPFSCFNSSPNLDLNSPANFYHYCSTQRILPTNLPHTDQMAAHPPSITHHTLTWAAPPQAVLPAIPKFFPYPAPTPPLDQFLLLLKLPPNQPFLFSSSVKIDLAAPANFLKHCTPQGVATQNIQPSPLPTRSSDGSPSASNPGPGPRVGTTRCPVNPYPEENVGCGAVPESD